MRKRDFAYDAQFDGYRCPGGQVLRYATTNRAGYREYKSDPAKCRLCPLIVATARAISAPLAAGPMTGPVRA